MKTMTAILRGVMPLIMMVGSVAGLGAEQTNAPGSTRSAFFKERPNAKELKTFSSFDAPEPNAEMLSIGAISFDAADLADVLNAYKELSHRTVIRSSALPAVKITFQNETPLTRLEALQALDTVLAENGVTTILMGTKFVKVVPFAQAGSEAGPMIDLPRDQLPESSSYMTYIVEVNFNLPHQVAPTLAPFAKMPNGIVAIDDAGILVLRDYSANIRRMLRVLDRVEKGPPPPPK